MILREEVKRLRAILAEAGIDPDAKPTLEDQIRIIEESAMEDILKIQRNTEKITGRRLGISKVSDYKIPPKEYLQRLIVDIEARRTGLARAKVRRILSKLYG